jgi:hypothetical protein
MTDLPVNDLDMVYNITDGKTVAGGYLVNSILLNERMPSFGGAKTKTHLPVEHSKVSERFKHLAVPAGLLYVSDASVISKAASQEEEEGSVINDELYDKLFKLAQADKHAQPEKSNTKSNTNKKKKKTNKKTKKRASRNGKKKTKRV